MAAISIVVAQVFAVAWLVAIAAVDRREGRIPNALVLPAVGLTAAAALWEPRIGVAAVVCASPYAIAFAMRLCGGGDVKLAVPCGGLLADPSIAAVLVVVAAVVALAVSAITKRSRGPHGPALVASTVSLLVLLK